MQMPHYLHGFMLTTHVCSHRERRQAGLCLNIAALEKIVADGLQVEERTENPRTLCSIPPKLSVASPAHAQGSCTHQQGLDPAVGKVLEMAYLASMAGSCTCLTSEPSRGLTAGAAFGVLAGMELHI